MRILHVCLASFYIDNYSYQENLLPKYHLKAGFETEILASNISFDDNGKITNFEGESSYYNENDILVHRIPYSRMPLSTILRRYKKTYDAIKEAKPDIIFVHGCQFIDISRIIKYLKEFPQVKVYVDNHADFNNSGKNFISRNILHRLIWRKIANLIEPYVEKFYGVLPARVDFIVDVYKIPRSRVELLVMGADDDKVNEAIDNVIIDKIKNSYNIRKDDFVIITGGKIDLNKLQIFNLIEAINKMNNPKVKLIIFGSIIPEYKEKFHSMLSDNVLYIGWINSNDVYKYFNMADLVVFPGLHSVLWEQAVGMGRPCVFKYIEGFTHIDIGGNCKFLYKDTIDEIFEVISDIILNENTYNQLLKTAENIGKEKFSYKNIALNSINLREV